MTRAGLHELREGWGQRDLGYLVASIYMAMEYERLDGLNERRGLSNQSFKVDQRELSDSEDGSDR